MATPYEQRPPEWAPYGRRERREREEREALRPYQGQTYYDLPPVKHSHYGWLIATYFFVGGLAGAAQVIATVADLIGRKSDRTIVRAGRYVALAGALASPALLIADLHTRQRWYNMLRIYRRTSPMSFGSWALAGFGTLSGLAATGQALEDVFGLAPLGRWLACSAGLPAAAFGVVVSYYTGVLLSATSTPLWAAAYRLLPAEFGASAVATATAALALAAEAAGAPSGAKRRLQRLALVAGAVELALTVGTDVVWRRKGVDGALHQQPIAAGYRFGVFGLGILAPLAVQIAQALTGRQSRLASVLASAATLAGGYIQRSVVVFAGNKSADRPGDYYRLTQSTVGMGASRDGAGDGVVTPSNPAPAFAGGRP